MCLTVTDARVKKAKKDITCYKFMFLQTDSLNKFKSYHKSFKYVLDKLYKKSTFRKQLFIGQNLSGGGFHSFRDKNNRVQTYINSIASPLTKDWTIRSVAVKCIIPKGSKYILGEQGTRKQYFSEKIILKKILTAKAKKK